MAPHPGQRLPPRGHRLASGSRAQGPLPHHQQTRHRVARRHCRHPARRPATGRITGPAHSARNRNASERPEQTISQFEAILRDMERVLGAAHPDTIVTQLDLAGVYQAVGARRKARRRYKRTLSTRLRSLGETHPLTRSAHERLKSAKTGG
ncbi:tetratricopeptide repeat protein [Streptomyces sp. NPDC085481]|uniref:tetratricopeptide repeat protein n=1 Tax=Streptomyces sp. NPDC085481 TaxID=3365727 RepID=UPI0037D92216